MKHTNPNDYAGLESRLKEIGKTLRTEKAGNPAELHQRDRLIRSAMDRAAGQSKSFLAPLRRVSGLP